MQRFTVYDGATLKSKDLSAWTADEWHSVFGSYFGTTDQSPRTLYSIVGWLYACVNLRADRVASMPWAIFRGETQLLSDEDDLTQYPYLDNFTDLLELTESALCLCGYAYWFKQRNARNAPLGLRWFAPDTIEPVYNAAVGIAGFRRYLDGSSGAYASGPATLVYTPEDIVYFKLPNAFSELEPGPPPARAALSDSSVLHNMGEFKSAFFARGAIKATILKVEKDTGDVQYETIKAWWGRFFSGVRKAWNSAVIRSDTLDAVIVGEGLESLSNSELTTESRQSIATALGVPHSIVAADAANFATAQQDELNFLTNCIIPESRLIERTLNRQMFVPVGLRFQFQPERLSAMQEDEEQRAQAYSLYVNSKMKPSIAAQLVGLSLPDGVTFDMLDEQLAQEQELQRAQAEAQTARLAQPRQLTGPTQADPRDEEVRRLKRWAKGKKQPDVDRFNSTILSREEKLAAVTSHESRVTEGAAVVDDAPFPYP